jgi:hypothetical protein
LAVWIDMEPHRGLPCVGEMHHVALAPAHMHATAPFLPVLDARCPFLLLTRSPSLSLALSVSLSLGMEVKHEQSTMPLWPCFSRPPSPNQLHCHRLRTSKPRRLILISHCFIVMLSLWPQVPPAAMAGPLLVAASRARARRGRD